MQFYAEDNIFFVMETTSYNCACLLKMYVVIDPPCTILYILAFCTATANDIVIEMSVLWCCPVRPWVGICHCLSMNVVFLWQLAESCQSRRTSLTWC